MDDFRFENTMTITESQYLAVWGILRKRRLSQIIRVGALAALGVLFLFSAYTLLLGLIVLGLVVVFVFIPKIVPFGARSTFRETKYLRDPLTYGVSDQKLWVRGARIDASALWSMLVTWREIEG